MRLFPRLSRFLQFYLGPDPVENPTDEYADAVSFCGWFRFPCEEPGVVVPFPNDCGGSAQRVPAASVEPPHDRRDRP